MDSGIKVEKKACNKIVTVCVHEKFHYYSTADSERSELLAVPEHQRRLVSEEGCDYGTEI